MRKVSPESVRDDFRAELQALTNFHRLGVTAFANESDRSTLTEHSLIAVAVAWEGFVNDMFIAYINRDATRFKEHLKKSVEMQLVAPRPKRVFASYGDLAFPKHLKKHDIEALADSAGGNITFPNFKELEAKAKVWLTSAHAAKFSGLTLQQKAVINAVVALRNHLAHRSKRSGDAMNRALAAGTLQGTGIKRADNRVLYVGAWLKATPPRFQETRFSLLVQILDGIGATF